jgi:hypothetical protein
VREHDQEEKQMRSKMGIRPLIWLLILFLIAPTGLGAQGQGADTAEKYIYTQEQLEKLLAPIALYPDVLLSQILMASTYPLEVVEASRWLKQNPNLADDRLDEALKDKPWDVSVKSLCHFPQVLSMMDEKLQQTTDLGDAFLGQQDQVMDTIQRLRAQAKAQGNLNSTEQQRVTAEDRDIIIEPAYPDVIYVPAYDPCWVYGPWWYPTCFPPWFWYPGFVAGRGFFWSPRIFVGPIGFWCGFSWRRHSIFINVNNTAFINRVGASRMHGGVEDWQHDQGHRRGVAYHDNVTAQRFGGLPAGGPGVEARRPFRGFAPQEIGPVQVRPLTRSEMRPESQSGGIERQGIQPREAPSGSHGFELPRSGPTGLMPVRPRSGGPFEGFGRSGIESQQQSERGRQSLGIGPQGGSVPHAVNPSPGGFSAPGNKGFSEGTRSGGGVPQGGGAHAGSGGGNGHTGSGGGEHHSR